MNEAEGMGEGVGRGGAGGRRIITTIDQAASESVATSAAKRYYAVHISEKPVALKRLVPETEAKSSSQISTAGFTGRSRLFIGEMADEKKPVSECSMCGDVGFVQDLLPCKRCGYRLQHTYCSKLYPDLDMENWACEWCLYEEENSGPAEVKLGKGKTESRSKAFEFLLRIAQASPSSSSSSSSERQKHRDDGEAVRISSREEIGFKCGAVKVGKAEQRQAQTPRYLKEENGFKFPGNLWENCKEDNGMKSGTQVPKKQRCSHTHPLPSYKSNKAVDNWKNLGRSKLYCSNTSKAIGRRYKLLADVLC